MNETTENVELVTLVTEEEEEQQKNELQRFTKKRSKLKKWIIFAVILAAAVGGYLVFAPKPQPQMQPTQVLAKQKLSNTVSLTGTIESADTQKVYTKATGMIQTVNVKVGDRVEAGDVLAQLDTEDLKLTIAGQQADIAQAQQKSSLNLSSDEKAYNNAVSDLKNDTNSSLAVAEQNLKDAQRELNDARRDLSEHKDDLNHADDVMNSLQKKRDRAQDAMEEANRAVKNADKDDPNYEALVKKADEATDEYEKALKEWMTADTEYGGEVTTYSKTYQRARQAYESALTNRDIAAQNAKRNLDTLNDTVELSRITGDMTSMQINMQKLQKQLGDSTIIAPISGTITAVYASEGEPASVAGPMFVIEDTDSLIIKTALKEYDVATVTQGMTAEIKTDATGDNVFEGEVSHIDPAAAKGTDGSVKTSGVEFATDINIISLDPALRVGMNVRVNVITAEKENVYAVPFDTVTVNEAGEKIIFTTKTDAEGKTVATAVPVTTGLETNFYIEITGDALSDGMVILTSPMGITEGMQIAVPAAPAADGASSGDAAASSEG